MKKVNALSIILWSARKTSCWKGISTVRVLFERLSNAGTLAQADFGFWAASEFIFDILIAEGRSSHYRKAYERSDCSGEKGDHVAVNLNIGNGDNDSEKVDYRRYDFDKRIALDGVGRRRSLHKSALL